MGPVSPFLRPPSGVAFLAAPARAPAAQAVSGDLFWEGRAATSKAWEAVWRIDRYGQEATRLFQPAGLGQGLQLLPGSPLSLGCPGKPRVRALRGRALWKDRGCQAQQASIGRGGGGGVGAVLCPHAWGLCP